MRCGWGAQPEGPRAAALARPSGGSAYGKGNSGGRNQRKGRGMSEVEASTCRLGEAATVAGRWREGEEVGHSGARPAVKWNEGAGKSRWRQVRRNPKRAHLREEEGEGQ
jgi:hypothetical protein